MNTFRLTAITIIKFVTASLITLSTTGVSYSNEIEMLTQDVTVLLENMRKACPDTWADLSVKIDEETAEVVASSWNNAPTENQETSSTETDKQEFIQFTQSSQPISANTIRHHCTVARTKLLSKYYSNLPQEVVAAMQDIDYEVGDVVDGFEVGDIRMTTREHEAKGWVFLEGQTVGPEGSLADLKGIEYRYLYDFAIRWSAQNSGGSVSAKWDNGDVVPLPNMREKVIAGGRLSEVGKEFGQLTAAIKIENMPSHNHSMIGAGAHSHEIYNDTHSHKIRTSQFEGSSIANYNNWGYFGQGKPRPEYHNTFAENKTIVSDTHKHGMKPAPSHTHGIRHTGSGRPMNIAQPTIQFRVEIKYK